MINLVSEFQSVANQLIENVHSKRTKIDNLDELMGLAVFYVGPVIDELYRKLLERDYAQDDPELVKLTATLTNFLGYDNRRPHRSLADGSSGRARSIGPPKSNKSPERVTRWRYEALSGSD